jgi:hypothetical protein
MKEQYRSGNCLSELTFWYAYKFIKKGNQKEVSIDDLYALDQDYLYLPNMRRFEPHFSKCPEEQSLLWKILGFFKLRFLLIGFNGIMTKTVLILTPYLLKEIISQLSNVDKGSASRIYSYSIHSTLMLNIFV